MENAKSRVKQIEKEPCDLMTCEIRICFQLLATTFRLRKLHYGPMNKAANLIFIIITTVSKSYEPPKTIRSSNFLRET